MIEWLILILQIVTILHLSESRDKGTLYVEGRRWATKEYYSSARTIEDLKLRVTRNLEPDEFERGALDALEELERRHYK